MGRRLGAPAKGSVYMLLEPSSFGLLAKSQTLLGHRSTNPQTFGGLV
ncbi:MAG: hypothetical protein LBF72_04090 [Holosporales bacterium]|nr:hypothetical protein [Holosporales bacterium]